MASGLYRQAGKIMKSKPVRAKLDRVADAIAVAAEGIAASEGVDANIGRKSGTRPLGRPYARVTADAEQEHGSARTVRRRVLGRAVQRR
jgi:hypothetical protein